MTETLFRIHLTDLFHRTKEGGASLQELAAAVVFNLQGIRRVAVHMPDDVDTADIDDRAYDFQEIVDDPYATGEEFDAALRDLFDWGNTSVDGRPLTKLCWVNVTVPRQRRAAA